MQRVQRLQGQVKGERKRSQIKFKSRFQVRALDVLFSSGLNGGAGMGKLTELETAGRLRWHVAERSCAKKRLQNATS